MKELLKFYITREQTAQSFNFNITDSILFLQANIKAVSLFSLTCSGLHS